MTDENERPTWTPPPEGGATPPPEPPEALEPAPEPEPSAAPEAAAPSEPNATPESPAAAPPSAPAEPAAASEPSAPAEPAAASEPSAVPTPGSVATPGPEPAPATPAAPDAAAIAAAEAATPTPPATPVAGPPVDATADQPTPPATVGQSRRRWAAAIGIVALIVIGIGLVAVLAGRGGLEAAAPRYLPATTIAYGDVRFDLPGDQRQEVTDLLARFPGFEDASTLEVKADDTFDRLINAATQGDATYTGDVKPWFGGQVAAAVTGLPDLSSMITGGAANLQVPVLGLISVKDATAAETTIGRLATQAQAAGMTVVTTQVDGYPTWTFSDGASSGAAPRSATVTLTKDMLVVGMDAAEVAKSVTLGTQGGPNLAGSSAYTDATAALPDARLATLYVDGAALKLTAGALTAVPGLQAAVASIPVSVAGALTVKDGTITATARTVRPDGAPPIVDTPSTLANEVPGAALAYVEMHDVGTAVSSLLAQVKAQPGIEALGVPVETIEGLLGAKLEDLFGWVGDVAVVGWSTNGEPAGAVVAQVTDPYAAEQRMQQVQDFLKLVSVGGAVTISTTSYAGAMIENATFTDAGTDVTISFTLSEGTFVLGLGEASVKAVLDVTPETALAADAGYQATMKAAGPSTNAGSAYVDLGGVREAVEPDIPAAQRSRYEQEVKPFLLPFDQLGAVTFQDGSATVSQTVITTKQP